MKIVFTKHALGKFTAHLKSGWKFYQKDIRETIKRPYFSGEEKERGVKFVLKRLDSKHDLRVIYKQDDDIITIVTFYPTEKERYIK